MQLYRRAILPSDHPPRQRTPGAEKTPQKALRSQIFGLPFPVRSGEQSFWDSSYFDRTMMSLITFMLSRISNCVPSILRE